MPGIIKKKTPVKPFLLPIEVPNRLGHGAQMNRLSVIGEGSTVFGRADSSRSKRMDLDEIQLFINEDGMSDDSRLNADPKVMRLRGDWKPGQYAPGDTVRDAGYLMTATHYTYDRAGPQPVGLPTTGLPDLPTWDAIAQNLSTVYSGHVYTFTKGGWIKALRVWVPAITATTSYRVVISNITDPNNIISDVYESSNLVAGEWVVLALAEHLIAPGTRLLLYIDALDSGSGINISGGWQSGGATTTPPIVGGWNTNAGFTLLRMSKTDLDTVDREAELAGVIPDSIASFVQTNNTNRGSTYRISGAAIDNGTYFSWEIVKQSDGVDGAPQNNQPCTTDISVPVPNNTQYIEQTAAYPTELPDWADVEGYLSFDGVQQAGNELDAFGVDIQFQPGLLSEDWYPLSAG